MKILHLREPLLKICLKIIIMINKILTLIKTHGKELGPLLKNQINKMFKWSTKLLWWRVGIKQKANTSHIRPKINLSWKWMILLEITLQLKLILIKGNTWIYPKKLISTKIQKKINKMRILIYNRLRKRTLMNLISINWVSNKIVEIINFVFNILF